MTEDMFQDLLGTGGAMSGAAVEEAVEAIVETKDKLISEPVMAVLIKLGFTVLIIFAGYVVIAILSRVIKRMLAKSKLDEVLHTFIINCFRILMWVMVLIAALGFLGVPAAPFVTALGAAGIAVALALQNSLANFAGGILILFTKPFSKGDHISNLEIEGLVQEIDLLYSTLETFDHKIITIPNGKLANSTIINYTRATNRRVDCVFRVSYHSDLEQVKSLLSAVADSDPRILSDPEPLIGVADYDGGTVTMDLRVWCRTEDYWDVQYFVLEQVKLAFEEAGVIMAPPQMDVRIKRR